MATIIPNHLTEQEASVILKLSVGVIIQQAELGNIPGRLVDGNWRFVQSEIEAWSEKYDQRKVLLRQAGAFEHDETLIDLQAEIDRQRKLNTIDAID
jgi:hypothetical protein